MTAGNGDENPGQLLEERAFWKQMFAAKPRTIVAPDSLERAKRRSAAAGQRQTSWIDRLFAGHDFYANASDKMVILKNGVEVMEFPIGELAGDTIIGRHPDAGSL